MDDAAFLIDRDERNRMARRQTNDRVIQAPNLLARFDIVCIERNSTDVPLGGELTQLIVSDLPGETEKQQLRNTLVGAHGIDRALNIGAGRASGNGGGQGNGDEDEKPFHGNAHQSTVGGSVTGAATIRRASAGVCRNRAIA